MSDHKEKYREWRGQAKERTPMKATEYKQENKEEIMARDKEYRERNSN